VLICAIFLSVKEFAKKMSDKVMYWVMYHYKENASSFLTVLSC